VLKLLPSMFTALQEVTSLLKAGQLSVPSSNPILGLASSSLPGEHNQEGPGEHPPALRASWLQDRGRPADGTDAALTAPVVDRSREEGVPASTNQEAPSSAATLSNRFLHGVSADPDAQHNLPAVAAANFQSSLHAVLDQGASAPGDKLPLQRQPSATGNPHKPGVPVTAQTSVQVRAGGAGKRPSPGPRTAMMPPISGYVSQVSPAPVVIPEVMKVPEPVKAPAAPPTSAAGHPSNNAAVFAGPSAAFMDSPEHRNWRFAGVTTPELTEEAPSASRGARAVEAQVQAPKVRQGAAMNLQHVGGSAAKTLQPAENSPGAAEPLQPIEACQGAAKTLEQAAGSTAAVGVPMRSERPPRLPPMARKEKRPKAKSKLKGKDVIISDPNIATALCTDNTVSPLDRS
jgi:hypothetical protein